MSEISISKGMIGALFASLDSGIGFSCEEGVTLLRLARLDVRRSGLAIATDPRAMVRIVPNRRVSLDRVTVDGDSLLYMIYLAAEADSSFLVYAELFSISDNAILIISTAESISSLLTFREGSRRTLFPPALTANSFFFCRPAINCPASVRQ